VPSPEPGCRTSTAAGTIARVRILIVDTCYPAFLTSHYSERPELADAPYEIQWRALMDRFFGTSDAYSHYLGELGHEAHEVVVNCAPLQRAWARERDVRLTKRLGLMRDRSLVLAQAEEFRPDVVYVQDLNALSPRLLNQLRPWSKLLVGQIASKLPPSRQLAPFDLLLSSLPHFATQFRGRGIASEYFRIGFDPRILAHVRVEPRAHDVVFVGAIGKSRTWRSNALLEQAAERAPIEFWGYRAGRLGPGNAVGRHYHGEAWGLDMYRVLARATIALNRHGDIAGDYANNMRLYEATGVGSLLLTDAKKNLGDLFQPGREVVTYRSGDELVKMIHYYLANEDERARIARAGQARTLLEHTYEQRMRELETILGRYFP
jgi:spore maturation protein CgeB